jgi:hypothetical protein
MPSWLICWLETHKGLSLTGLLQRKPSRMNHWKESVERVDLFFKIKSCKCKMTSWSLIFVNVVDIILDSFILDYSLEPSHGCDYLESDPNDQRPDWGTHAASYRYEQATGTVGSVLEWTVASTKVGTNSANVDSFIGLTLDREGPVHMDLLRRTCYPTSRTISERTVGRVRQGILIVDFQDVNSTTILRLNTYALRRKLYDLFNFARSHLRIWHFSSLSSETWNSCWYFLRQSQYRYILEDSFASILLLRTFLILFSRVTEIFSVWLTPLLII